MSSGGKKAMDMRIIHTMPLFIRESSREHDLDMASLALGSLQRSQDHVTVLFNQGCLTNEELHDWLQTQGISAMIRGNGTNIGIAAARQACFEFIWEHFPQIEYLSEIHVDMIFPPNWYAPFFAIWSVQTSPWFHPASLLRAGNCSRWERSFFCRIHRKGSAKRFSAPKRRHRGWIRASGRSPSGYTAQDWRV